MKIKKLYPQGKKKAFNVTYDDGILQDVRFVELLNKYNLKGTFNLNSYLMETEFEWQHESGATVKRLSKEAAKKLYKGHEIASHTCSHPYMESLSKDAIMWELKKDKENLSELFDCEICGFALPFSYYNDTIKECVKECGFVYGRISEESYSYSLPEDNYAWKAGIFHLSEHLLEFVEGFMESEEELALCQIVGHSYDLEFEEKVVKEDFENWLFLKNICEAEDTCGEFATINGKSSFCGMWEIMEAIFERISKDNNIISMTNLEIVRYINAMKMAVITDEYIENNSDICLWFEVDGKVIEVLGKSDFHEKK